MKRWKVLLAISNIVCIGIFGNFNLSDAKWLYTVGRKYYYATGFNLLRLSDKLEIDYKYGIFKDVSIVERNLRILMSE